MLTNYRRGARLEYRVKQRLEAAGFYVVRSAGSHGVADLVGIKDGQVYLVQVKGKRASQNERKGLEEVVAKYGGFGIWVERKGRRLSWEIFYDGEWRSWEV